MPRFDRNTRPEKRKKHRGHIAKKLTRAMRARNRKTRNPVESDLT